MDWMERQIPPPSWHDGDIFEELTDDTYSPLTSVVRRCYLRHLEQTLLQNYNLYKTHTIQPSTLQDVLLGWEQSALRSCMVTTLYQRAMCELINAIKDDTNKHKLTSVLKANIKRSQRHLVDVSTQTEPDMSTPNQQTLRQPTLNELETRNNLKRERSVTRESSDGPFLTPPSDYPIPIPAKKPFRQQLPLYPKTEPVLEAIPPFPPPLPQVPYQYTTPPPNMYAMPPQPFSYQYPSWPEPQQEHGQPISVITSAIAGHQYEDPQCSLSPPKLQDSLNYGQPELSEPPPMDALFGNEHTNVEFTYNESGEPDYNWDDIERELSRVCGQVFTGDDGNGVSEELEPEPVPALVPPPSVLPNEPSNTDLELPSALHETKLHERLEFIRTNWSLERQAKLKRRFIELFGREDDEDALSQVTAKEATKCKQMIAPWIVKHLMPLYKEKRIASRSLFKSLAKHISDLLIQRNLYPDECDVWMGVQEFFSGGTNIKCEADFAA